MPLFQFNERFYPAYGIPQTWKYRPRGVGSQFWCLITGGRLSPGESRRLHGDGRAALDGGINLIDVRLLTRDAWRNQLRKGAKRYPARVTQYYLATKVGSYSEAKGDYDYSAGRTERSLHESLKRLGVDYVDLIQCHDVDFRIYDQIVNETLPALHRLKQQGVARFIGITGLPLKVFPSILDRVDPGTIDTILSYCHYELNDNSLADLIPYRRKKA